MGKEFEKFKELEDLKHKNKMEQLKYQRDTLRLQHELEKERMRIKTAEIRRSIILKSKERRQ